MATTNRSTAEPDDAASDVASAIQAAELAHLLVRADGDSLAAAGMLAAACDAGGVPYHVSVVRTAAEVAGRLDRADATATPVVLGTETDDAVGLDPDGPVSPLAYDATVALGAEPAPAAALAGVVAAGGVPSQATPELLEAAGLERTAGVAIPTDDLVDGIAHTGLAHATFSGDVDATRQTLSDLGLATAHAREMSGEDARRVASMLALSAGGAPGATARAATAVERVLRPYPTDGPFATLAGHADVLCALAELAPGLAVALAVGTNGTTSALDVWREHGRAAHQAVREAETARYRGVVVARTDGPVSAVARLLRDFRSPEPVVLAVGEGEAAAASVDAPVGGPLAAAAGAAGGSSLARGQTGFATFDPTLTERLVDAFREAR